MTAVTTEKQQRLLMLKPGGVLCRYHFSFTTMRISNIRTSRKYIDSYSSSYSTVFFFLLLMPLLTSGCSCSILYYIQPLSSEIHARTTTQWTKKSVLHTNINLYLHLIYTDNNRYIKGGNYRYKTYDTVYYGLNFLFCRYFGANRSCRRICCISHVARYAIF